MIGKETSDAFTRVTNTRRQILSLQPLLQKGNTLVVGTLHDCKGIGFMRKAVQKPSLFKGVDLLEVRLDTLSSAQIPELVELIALRHCPIIATARHPQEGGGGNLSQSSRAYLLESSLPWASALDIELRSVRGLSPMIARTHQLGKTLILSHHDFIGTPTLQSLKKLASRAADQGADLFKVATLLRDRRDLQRLIDLQLSQTAVPVVAMGMGAAGRFSRVVLAGFGTPLCYGWIGSPQVPGQWPALALREILNEVLPL
jgi:3-dehydroquinate dehydratase I